MSQYEKIRILVIGDSGVGKTALVHLLCNDEASTSTTWTIGCQVEVALHQYTPNKKKFFVEFFDVGGSAKSDLSRGMFYSHVDGIILVHDLGNRKSHANLSRWLCEVADALYDAEEGRVEEVAAASAQITAFFISPPEKKLDPQQYQASRAGAWPLLVVANKVDLLGRGARPRKGVVEQLAFDSIELSALDATAWAQDTETRRRVETYLDKVVQKKFYPTTVATPISPAEPSRPRASSNTFKQERPIDFRSDVDESMDEGPI